MCLIGWSLVPHNLHLLFYCFVYSCFEILSPYGVVQCCNQNRFSFSRKVSICLNVQVFSWEISLGGRLKCPYGYFSSHFFFLVKFFLLKSVLSVLFLVAVISLLPLFYAVFLSLYQWIDAILDAGNFLFLLLFSTHAVCLRYLWDVRPYSSS